MSSGWPVSIDLFNAARTSAVIRVKGVASSPPFQFLELRAEIFEDLAVREFEVTGRCPESDEGRNAIEDQPKTTLARTQGFLSPPSVLDIGVHSAPFDDLSGCVDQRTSTKEEPAILSIEATQARFHFTWLARSQGGSPALEQVRQVFGVDRSLPSPTTGFLDAEAGVFAPALIQEVDAPIRERSPYQPGGVSTTRLSSFSTPVLPGSAR